MSNRVYAPFMVSEGCHAIISTLLSVRKKLGGKQKKIDASHAVHIIRDSDIPF